MNGASNSSTHYDLVVIGSGAAGHHGAIQAAKLGNKTAVVEQHYAVGGICINTETIASKTLREAVVRLAGFRPREQDLASRIEQVASNEVRVFENQFRRNGVDVLTGKASFVGPHEIQVESGQAVQFCHAERVLIATGTRPAHNEAIPVDGVSILDTNAIRTLPPQRRVVTIVGGGVIGIEYACIAAALGVS